ncbi:MAG TPA: hypothetical protein VK087_03130 [Tissierellaceae bacterium]|nr:hypothetical protein [Tissierellaceae bacterium]
MEKLQSKTRLRKVLGLIAFIATGAGLKISTAINEESFYKTAIVIIIGCFFAVGLVDHFRKLILGDDSN